MCWIVQTVGANQKRADKEKQDYCVYQLEYLQHQGNNAQTHVHVPKGHLFCQLSARRHEKMGQYLLGFVW
jgi:hypothetical protein